MCACWIDLYAIHVQAVIHNTLLFFTCTNGLSDDLKISKNKLSMSNIQKIKKIKCETLFYESLPCRRPTNP